MRNVSGEPSTYDDGTRYWDVMEYTGTEDDFPTYRGSFQHPDCGWCIDVYWNYNRDGMVEVDVADIDAQACRTVSEDDDEYPTLYALHQDMLVFARRVAHFQPTRQALWDYLTNHEGVHSGDL